jgi:NADH-quinone oxidoreductase subunit C
MTQANQAATHERVATALAGIEGFDAAHLGPDQDGTLRVTATPASLHAICAALRDGAGFSANTFVTAVDHGVGRAQRFELFYQFLNVDAADRVRVRVMTEGEYPSVPTISDLWPGTSFSERECFDMFGIRFDGHPDLRRLLMPQGYDHHPLRKEFPHVGIEPDRLYREWDEQRRAEYALSEAARLEDK